MFFALGSCTVHEAGGWDSQGVGEQADALAFLR